MMEIVVRKRGMRFSKRDKRLKCNGTSSVAATLANYVLPPTQGHSHSTKVLLGKAQK